MTVFIVCVYVGGFFAAREKGRSWIDCMVWPGDLGCYLYGLAHDSAAIRGGTNDRH